MQSKFLCLVILFVITNKISSEEKIFSDNIISTFPEQLVKNVKETARRMRIWQLLKEEQDAAQRNDENDLDYEETSFYKALIARVQFAKENPDIIDQQNYFYKQRIERNTILLYGPKGNGKTSVAREIAKFTGSEIIERKASSLVNRYVGTGSNGIKKLFQEAKEKIDNGATVVIFIDEIHRIAQDTDSEMRAEHQDAVTELWCQLSDISRESRILVIFATNDIKKLNSKFMDRIRLKINIEKPKFETRKQLIAYYLNQAEISLADTKLADFYMSTKLATPEEVENYLINKYAKYSENLSIRKIEDFFADKIKDIPHDEKELFEAFMEMHKPKTKNVDFDKNLTRTYQIAVIAGVVLGIIKGIADIYNKNAPSPASMNNPSTGDIGNSK